MTFWNDPIFSNSILAVEKQRFTTAEKSGDIDAAWDALERIHILSQTQSRNHIVAHWLMLLFAYRQRDIREVFGQIIRLLLAPVGNITRRLPTGNTGRANVSAFVSMPVPADLRAALAQINRSRSTSVTGR